MKKSCAGFVLLQERSEPAVRRHDEEEHPAEEDLARRPEHVERGERALLEEQIQDAEEQHAREGPRRIHDEIGDVRRADGERVLQDFKHQARAEPDQRDPPAFSLRQESREIRAERDEDDQVQRHFLERLPPLDLPRRKGDPLDRSHGSERARAGQVKLEKDRPHKPREVEREHRPRPDFHSFCHDKPLPAAVCFIIPRIRRKVK